MTCQRCGGRMLQLEREALKCVSCGREPATAQVHRQPERERQDHTAVFQDARHSQIRQAQQALRARRRQAKETA